MRAAVLILCALLVHPVVAGDGSKKGLYALFSLFAIIPLILCSVLIFLCCILFAKGRNARKKQPGPPMMDHCAYPPHPAYPGYMGAPCPPPDAHCSPIHIDYPAVVTGNSLAHGHYDIAPPMGMPPPHMHVPPPMHDIHAPPMHDMPYMHSPSPMHDMPHMHVPPPMHDMPHMHAPSPMMPPQSPGPAFGPLRSRPY
eukprot:TRINITY_DN1490_c0_g1_i1.p1 TRINITY_DN1490_c0_g1~~TRINITY_DN1490_c0_g1_i1.p1  ORF type:complete len:197 (-),score=2.56 TRINITY_DN1490_c0_g1_i1:401-991(-)